MKHSDVTILEATTDFYMEVSELPPRRVDETPSLGYRVINKHTGVAEAEGSNYANVLVGLHYIQDEYTRIVADPRAEVTRRATAMQTGGNPLAQLFAQAESDGETFN